jgi:hypothetical protein
MLLAALGAILELAVGQRRRFMATLLRLLGASAVALPGVAIGLGTRINYMLMIAPILTGIAIIAGAARLIGTNQAIEENSLTLKVIQTALVVAVIGSWIYLDGFPYSTVSTLLNEYPFLCLFAFGGLVALAASAHSMGGSMLLFAVLLEPFYEGINHFATTWSGDIFQSGFGDIGVKLEDYWCPYFFAILAGIAGSWLVLLR